MTEQRSDTIRVWFDGGLATVALVLNVVALMASTICLASFFLSDASVAMTAGATALITFASGIVSHAVARRQRTRGHREVLAHT